MGKGGRGKGKQGGNRSGYGNGSSGKGAECEVEPLVSPPGAAQIDGSILEGGGQILRMTSAYSALLTKPIHITKIRGGRSKPGLAAQHLESLRLVRDVSAATMVGDTLRSMEITLAPAPLAPGNFAADPGTAGAITLMVQASLFPLLFAGGTSTCNLRGGTDVSFSPPLDFLRRVFLPTVGRMGAVFSVDVLLRGFMPRGGGHIRVSTPPVSGPLRPVDLSERGEVRSIEATLHATRGLGREEAAAAVEEVRKAASQLGQEVRAAVSHEPAVASAKHWVDIVVETTSGALFHGGSEPKDLPAEGMTDRAGRGVPHLFAAAAGDAVKPLAADLASGAAVGEHLADQLVLPASLAQGRSKILAAELSLHTTTAIHIAKLLVPGVAISVKERPGGLTLVEIDGVGYVSGGDGGGALPSAQPNDVVQLSQGALSAAAASMLADFENDMWQLSEATGAKVAVDKAGDRLLVSGGTLERGSAQAELRKVLHFYFGHS